MEGCGIDSLSLLLHITFFTWDLKNPCLKEASLDLLLMDAAL